jgi:hypothetical protein
MPPQEMRLAIRGHPCDSSVCRLRIQRGKTDQAGRGAEIGLPRGRHAETCPLRAFWQAVAPHESW